MGVGCRYSSFFPTPTPIGFWGMPPAAPGVKASPQKTKGRFLGPLLDVLTPVGWNVSPMGGSAGEEGRQLRPLVAVRFRTATDRGVTLDTPDSDNLSAFFRGLFAE